MDASRRAGTLAHAPPPTRGPAISCLDRPCHSNRVAGLSSEAHLILTPGSPPA